MRGLREAAELHYELVPYLYALAQEASQNGLPVVRPLGLTWPQDGQAWASSLELTVGDALLAAPVTTDGSSSTVYLPAGTWIDLFTGARHTGGHSTTRANGAYDFPLYLRAGSALPFNSRSPRIWPDAWKARRPPPPRAAGVARGRRRRGDLAVGGEPGRTADSDHGRIGEDERDRDTRTQRAAAPRLPGPPRLRRHARR